MLVLSRTKGEVLRIGNHIKVVVVEIRGDKVRLGVDAPKELPVHREEVFSAIEKTTCVGPLFKYCDGGLVADIKIPNSLVHPSGWYVCACSRAIAGTIAAALGGTLVIDDSDDVESLPAEFEVTDG